MSKRLPYRATTASGNQFEFELPLHPDTGSAVNVANLLTAVLAALDHEARQIGSVSNGDVLQAVAMALAIRTRILPGQAGQLAELARGLLENALGAGMVAAPGNLPPDEARGVH